MIYTKKFILEKMKCYSRLVLLISLLIIYAKTAESTISFTALDGCVYDSATGYDKLVDGKISTTWFAPECSFEGQSEIFYVYFKASEVFHVTGYTITLAEDGARYYNNNPKNWVLKAKKNEKDGWLEIDSKNNINLATGIVNYGNYSYIVQTPGLYQYFVYIVTSTYWKGDPINLGELWLMTFCPNNTRIETEIGCTCNNNICKKGQLCKGGNCLYDCPSNGAAPNIGCICGGIKNICNGGELCNSNNICVPVCTSDNTAPNIGCICGGISNICNNTQLCKDGKCLSDCPSNGAAPNIGCICGGIKNICNGGELCNSNNSCVPVCTSDNTAPNIGCICGGITNICNEGQLCNSNNNCLSDCPRNNTAPDIGCICGGITNICNEGQLCNSNNNCLSDCPSDNTAPDIGCICGGITNICNEGQLCKDGNCLSPCPNDDIAPEIGCICGANRNVCNEGQICNIVDCWYPTPTPVSVLFLIIGLFFALTLMFSFVLYLNLLIK